MSGAKPPTLREQHAAATRALILEHAYDLLIHHPGRPFSHEAVARRARVGARTVYRHFPTQSDLYEALWTRVRKDAGSIFPSTEEQILPQIPILFGGFNRNEKLIRAVLESPAGHRVRERAAPEGRAAFAKSLARLTAGMPRARKRKIVAIFLAIYSAPFWDLLRQRGGLSGADAISAAEWAMTTLIEGLRSKRPPARNQENDHD